MTDKELKRLRRADLLKMLIVQMEENERLEKSLKEARESLADREIRIKQAGSIAEAAMQLNGVFAAAQEAAAQYLENIERLNREQEVICQQMEADARKKAEAICVEADAYSCRIRSEADAYRKQVVEKVQAVPHVRPRPRGKKS